MACTVCASDVPQAGCPACNQLQPTLFNLPPPAASLSTERERIATIERWHGRLTALRALDRPVLVTLVGCSKQKRAKPCPAKDLYLGQTFRRAMRYAEKASDEVFILSAKFGLLRTHDWIGPYDCAMQRLPARVRQLWAEEVVGRLAGYLPRLPLTITILAGQDYAIPFLDAVGDHRWSFQQPLKGLRGGCQKQWLQSECERLERDPLSVYPPNNRSDG